MVNLRWISSSSKSVTVVMRDSGFGIPPDVLEKGGRPLLQYQADTLESTIEHARSAGVALRDRVAADIAAHCPEPRLDLLAGGPVRE